MKTPVNVPDAAYGILRQNRVSSDVDEVVEQVRHLGFAILNSGYSESELGSLAREFDRTHEEYVEAHGESELRRIHEFHTIRAPLTHGGEWFLKLAMNENLLAAIKQLIPGKFILNQQNGLINPPREAYNQGAWHRDLPYQHFVSSVPLAINALFCVDDFNVNNGATFVLPASHKSEAFPSPEYIRNNAIQVEAKAGCFIVIDCMAFHAGGFNGTEQARRAVNHVYNIPYLKQQINIPSNMRHGSLSAEQKEILGFDYQEPGSISEYLSSRAGE